MAGAARGRRVMLLFAVLAGLFLMHGLTAGGAVGCHGGTAGMAMTRTRPMPVAVPQAGMRTGQTVSGDPGPMTDHAQPGETCVPLRPEGLSGLFLALFLIVITLWRPRLPHSARLIRPHWPHGPPRTGIHILRTLSISRT